MKRLVIGGMSALAFLMTFVAQASAASACMLLFYDPSCPKPCVSKETRDHSVP